MSLKQGFNHNRFVIYYLGDPLVIVNIGKHVISREKLLYWYAEKYEFPLERLTCSESLAEISYKPTTVS